MSVKNQLQNVQASIEEACQKSNRNAADVNIVAVTKYVSIDRTKEALEAGVEHIGENRAEDGMAKWNELGDNGIWHFIGNLQSRKVKEMIHAFDYIHSLDRMSLAKEVQKRTPEGEKKKCFVQVNVSGESSKSGLSVEETIPFIKELCKYKAIEVVGLMTMAPFVEDAEEVRPYFRKLRELKEEIQQMQLPHAPCSHLSMGMSNDYTVAVEEGATFIRVGSALVG
ncbi:YggS family pyridoxal phosphate-dependent enzyme [Bacillus shivajii]|uniref:YggS family pyridoxal phosphate-dependent enzyme n=1 Tax=Bacillus shivajii TaxID=1983719 RepID=UPI001CF98962|nr:YggS family pyridoxal phosphate-dependent enzyme [Bacillus shivajii]UCZ51812.1 YggS family pyridoxal phosphate-dependent enzyme [Bacillus shivajii]